MNNYLRTDMPFTLISANGISKKSFSTRVNNSRTVTEVLFWYIRNIEPIITKYYLRNFVPLNNGKSERNRKRICKDKSF